MPLTVAMALSGIEPDQWNTELKDIYNQGASIVNKCITKSPSSSSLSSGGSSYYSMESGISSLSPDCGNKPTNSLSIYVELIVKLERLIEIGLNGICSRSVEASPVKEIENIEIIYNKRDLLDLGSNITNWNYKTASLPQGVINDNYFENRSQYSRLANVMPPAHKLSMCCVRNCGFQEPYYY